MPLNKWTLVEKIKYLLFLFGLKILRTFLLYLRFFAEGENSKTSQAQSSQKLSFRPTKRRRGRK